MQDNTVPAHTTVSHASIPIITVFSSRCLPCEIIRFLSISRLLQIACGAALGRFYWWKQFCVSETYAPTHMALGRGADEAATARKGQRENRDESGESCHCRVEHLVSHFIFAKVHNLCGQGSRHLVQRCERHYVVFEELARPPSHPLRALLRRMRMANVGARGGLGTQPVQFVQRRVRFLYSTGSWYEQ